LKIFSKIDSLKKIHVKRHLPSLRYNENFSENHESELQDLIAEIQNAPTTNEAASLPMIEDQQLTEVEVLYQILDLMKN